MTAPLYTTEILRLAARTAGVERLREPMASVAKRSPVCGSEVTVDVMVDDDGRITQLGMRVRACALGQASSALVAEHALGLTARDLAETRDALTAWLGGGDVQPDWPGLHLFAPARPHRARHPSITLAFSAAAEAAEAAAAHAPVR